MVKTQLKIEYYVKPGKSSMRFWQMKQNRYKVEKQMLAAEAFLRKSIDKTPFTVKTVLELVAILKLESGQSRDCTAIAKCVRELYSSDFMKAHMEKMSPAQRERLDKFMSSGLDQFIELAHDSLPVVKSTWGACMPLLCGGVAPVMVEPLVITPKNAAAAAAVEEKMIVAATETVTADESATVTAVEVAAVVATTQEVILEVKDTLAQVAAAVDTLPSTDPSS